MGIVIGNQGDPHGRFRILNGMEALYLCSGRSTHKAIGHCGDLGLLAKQPTTSGQRARGRGGGGCGSYLCRNGRTDQ